MEIETQLVTYKELKEGFKIKNDNHQMSQLCGSALQRTFLANPFLIDYNKTFMYISRVNQVAAGIAMWYPTKVKAGDEIVDAEGSSTLEVYEEYRKLAIGADIVMYPIVSNQHHFLIYAGISEQALKIYKKLKFSIFEYPRSMQIRNLRSLFESKGIKGALLKVMTAVGNVILRGYYSIANSIASSYKQYQVKQLKTVPKWVNEIVLNDGHKYMELHDQTWLQWNLENNLHNEKDDKQSFYAVYEQEKPVAFFMTKERFRDIAGGELRDIVIGSIMEWGVAAGCSIGESDLYVMASKTFSKKTDIVEFATTDGITLKKMKRMGFIPHGNAHIAVKDLTYGYKDYKDINNWRIRFGYADVLLT